MHARKVKFGELAVIRRKQPVGLRTGFTSAAPCFRRNDEVEGCKKTILAHRGFAGLRLRLLLTCLPSGSAEHRSEGRGFGVRVFERSEFPGVSRPSREAQGTRAAGAVLGVAFSLVPFFGAAEVGDPKERYLVSGNPRHENTCAARR